MATGQMRGSQKLMSALAAEVEQPSVGAIKAALSLPAASEIKILRWHPIGIPPVYREFEAMFEAPVTQLNTLLDALIAVNDSALRFKIFPFGLPTIDRVNVSVITSGEF